MVAGSLLWAASVAAGQTPAWSGREFWSGGQLDEAVDVALWSEPGVTVWAYVTGYLTVSPGVTVYATYKYDLLYSGPSPQPPDEVAFFPDVPQTAVGQSKPVAITVDSGGNVYVTGSSPYPLAPGQGLNYVTIKYDAKLIPSDTWGDQGLGEGVRSYTGPGVANDVPAGIVIDPAVHVNVTGTSPGTLTGNDVATVRYDVATGALSTSWPAIPGLGGVGERRYNNPVGFAHDTAVGIAAKFVEGALLIGTDDVFVLATSYGGDATGYDMVTICYGGPDGTPYAPNGWTVSYDGPTHGHEKAAAITTGLNRVFITGSTPHVGGSFAGGSSMGAAAPPPPPNTDYCTVAYVDTTGAAAWSDVGFGPGARHWDGGVNDDEPAAIAHRNLSNADYVWVTGRTRRPVLYDFGTLQYGATGGLNWAALIGLAVDRDDQGVDLAASDVGAAYVTGRGMNAAGNYDYFTVKYPVSPQGPPYLPDWTVPFNEFAGTDLPRAIAIDAKLMPPRIIVVGQSYKPGFGQDLVSVSYTDP